METVIKVCGRLLIVMVIMFGASCDDDQDEIQKELDNLEFRLAVLDENGEEKSSFEAGSDIRLVLMLNNKSGQDFLWKVSDGCHLRQQEDFFLVYRISRLEEGGTSQPVIVGRPDDHPVNCQLINLTLRSIAPGEQSIVSTIWLGNPDNSPLPSGQYFSELSCILSIDGHDKRLELGTEFTIG